MPEQQNPSVSYATLYLWHAELSVDALTEELGIEPTMWHSDGDVIKEGYPSAVGNRWLRTESGSEAVTRIVEPLASIQKQFRRLLEVGARSHLNIHFKAIEDGGLPVIPDEHLRLVTNIGIDIWFLHDHSKRSRSGVTSPRPFL